MTFLIVLLAVLLCLFLLTLVPIKAKIEFTETFSVEVRYLFFKLFFFTSEEGKEPKTPQEKAEDKVEDAAEKGGKSIVDKLKRLFQKEGFSGFLSFFSEVAKLVAGAAKGLLLGIKIKTFSLDLTVSGDDAAEIAMLYGRACAVVYPAYALIFEYIRCKDQHLQLQADFEKGSHEIVFLVKLQIRVLTILVEVIKALIKLLPLYRRLNSANPKTAEKRSNEKEKTEVSADRKKTA